MPYNRKKKIQQKGAVTFSEPFCISWLSVLGREKLDSSPAERDWGDLAQQQTERESTLCPGSQEGQLYPAVHQAWHSPQVRVEGALLCSSAAA